MESVVHKSLSNVLDFDTSGFLELAQIDMHS